jgi:uncharacterized protein DUF4389
LPVTVTGSSPWENAAMAAIPSERPVRLVVRGDELDRSRLTTFFRLLLAIPVLVWLFLRGIAAFVVAFVNWLAVLIQGEVPDSLHDFVASYVRYAAQVSAYVFLAADPYPWFRVQADYPVDVEIDPPTRQSRWTGFFRLVLALPALALAATLGGGLGGSSGSSGSARGGDEYWAASWGLSAGGVAAVAAFLAWFFIVARGLVPRGIRDLVRYAIGYSAQALGYLLLVTGRYPTSDPALAEPYAELPRHPVRMVVVDGLERSRVTVLFRLLLAIPHFVWIALWSIAVVFAVFVAWVAALVTGQVPAGLHRFLAAYVRYAVHLQAYVFVVGRRFPGFTGQPGYGIDLEIDPPRPQRRLVTLFRLVLAIPALLLAGALGGVLFVAGFLGWWYALVRGRMPEGLRNLGAICIRYGEQTSAYVLLLTDRYPYGAPVLQGRPEPQPTEPAAPILGDAF